MGILVLGFGAFLYALPHFTAGVYSFESATKHNMCKVRGRGWGGGGGRDTVEGGGARGWRMGARGGGERVEGRGRETSNTTWPRWVGQRTWGEGYGSQGVEGWGSGSEGEGQGQIKYTHVQDVGVGRGWQGKVLGVYG